MRLLLIAGHGANDPGACSDFGIEREETRKVVAELVNQFKSYNDIVVEVYPTGRNAYADVQNGTVQVNFADYDYVFEVHFNSASASANGVEVWVTPMEETITIEQNIVNKISDLGFTYRGVKEEYFAVITSARSSGTSSALLETCFISNQDDMNTYRNKFTQICSAVVEAIAEGFGLTRTVPKKEEIKKVVYDMKNLVVYGNSVDRRAAEYLADFLQCPTIDGNIPFDYSKVETVICVGGKPSLEWTGYADKIITGSDRFDTMIEVLKFIGKI